METNDKMEDLKQQRKERGEREMDLLRSKYWRDKQIQERKTFDRLSATESLLDLKYQSDILVLMELFTEWDKKAKTKEQKGVINESFMSVLRVQNYVSTLQTVSKSSVTKLLEYQIKNNSLISENEKLKKQIQAQLNEIKYYEQNGKN